MTEEDLVPVPKRRPHGNTGNRHAAGHGRPSKYREQYAHEAHTLCLLGLTDERLAKHFEVTIQTYYKWRRDFPDFEAAIKDGKLIADGLVAYGLYMRGKGMQLQQQRIVMKTTRTKDSLVTEPVVVDYEVTIPPDTQAASFWLSNRHRDLWRMPTRESTTPDDGVTVIEGGLPDAPPAA